MDLSYDVFHGSRRTANRTKWNTTGQANSSVFHAPAQFLSNPFGAVGSVAAQTIRLPVDALSAAAHLALHPGGVASRLAETFQLPARSVQEQHGVLARRARLLEELKNATSWNEYSATATKLDEVEGAEVWKNVDEPELYDEICLKERLDRLSEALRNDDLPKMMRLVRTELTRDLGGICNPELHQQTRVGTKYIIEHYIQTVGKVLDCIVKACARGDSRIDKFTVENDLKQTRLSYGRTALLLSGGGTLGMVHIGVIKALYEAGALPRVISGSSSGSIVAAVLGNTTDEELLPVLEDFCHGDLKVFVGPHEKPGWTARVEHFGTHGYIWDADNLRRVMIDLLGKTTFLEAYNRTRRILNIAVSNSTEFESQPVLNYATSPNVAIWSAVVASCGVPFGFDPERLLQKGSTATNFTPWDSSTLHVDGSIEGDVPSNKLSAQFDVNHTIVSQVNPHVSPFLDSDTKLRGRRGLYWSTIASLARDEGTRSLEILGELPFFPKNLITKLRSVLGQRYSGDITLCPADPFRQFWTILENPTLESMEEALRQGESATWPVVSMIKTHLDIELLIDNAYRKVLEHVSFSRSASDLRRLQIKQNGKLSHSSGGRERSGWNTESTRIPRLVDRWPTSESFVMSTRPIFPEGLAIKVPGELASPSSESHSSYSSSGSDDESDSEDGFDSPLLRTKAEPNTTWMETPVFVDTPKSGSPRALSPTLKMTPRVPMSSSPETKQKNLFNGVDASSTPIPKSTANGIDTSGAPTTKSPRLPTRLSPGGNTWESLGVRSPSVPTPTARQRSSSTGLRGLPEPGRQ